MTDTIPADEFGFPRAAALNERLMSNARIYTVAGEPATLDELLEAFDQAGEDQAWNLIDVPGIDEARELLAQAHEMMHLRERARSAGKVPPAPMAWLPMLQTMQEEVK